MTIDESQLCGDLSGLSDFPKGELFVNTVQDGGKTLAAVGLQVLGIITSKTLTKGSCRPRKHTF